MKLSCSVAPFPCSVPVSSVSFSNTTAFNRRNMRIMGAVCISCTRGSPKVGSREPKGLNTVKPFPSFLRTWQGLSFSGFVMRGTILEFSLELCWRGGRIQVLVSEAALALRQYQQVLHSPCGCKKWNVNKASLRSHHMYIGFCWFLIHFSLVVVLFLVKLIVLF